MDKIRKYMKDGGCPLCGNFNISVSKVDDSCVCLFCGTKDIEIEKLGIYNTNLIINEVKHSMGLNKENMGDVMYLRDTFIDIVGNYVE